VLRVGSQRELARIAADIGNGPRAHSVRGQGMHFSVRRQDVSRVDGRRVTPPNGDRINIWWLESVGCMSGRQEAGGRHVRRKDRLRSLTASHEYTQQQQNSRTQCKL